MKAEQVLGFLKKYVDDTLKGAGALKGEKGEPGEKGEKGDPGEKGEKGEPGTTIANEVTYDNAQSGLSSTDVQGAIDEVSSNLTSLEDDSKIKNVVGTEFELLTSQGGIRTNKILGCTHKSKNLNALPYYATAKELNGVNITYNDDGSLTLNGTANTDMTFITLHSRIRGEKNGLSLPVGKYKLSGCPKGGSLSTYFVQITETVGGTAQTICRDYGDGTVANLVANDYSDTDVLIGLQIKVCNGITVNNLVFKPMVTIDLGATYDDFEPYGITSSGDSGSIEVKEHGKNLIHFPYYDGIANVSNGITFKVNNDGSITANGTATKESAFNLINPFSSATRKKVKLGQRYILIDGLEDRTKAYIQFVRYDSSKKEFNWVLSTSLGNRIWTENSANLVEYGIRLIVRNGATVDNVVFKPMLVEVNEDGSYPTEYEMYKSNTVSIPLSESLKSIGDVKDKITKDGIVRRVKSMHIVDVKDTVFASTVNDGDTTKCYRFTLDSARVNGAKISMCNRFETTLVASEIKQGKCLIIDNGSALHVYLPLPATIDTTELAKQYVTDNDVEVIYELDTPTTEQLTNEQKVALNSLVSFKDKTYIDTSDLYAKATFDLDYFNSDSGSLALQNENDVEKLKQAIIELGGTM